MRNARNTRRRSVKVGLPAALSCACSSPSSSAGCGSSPAATASSAGSSGGAKLDVVGYSTPESVYAETLEPAFEKTSAGQGHQLQQLLRCLRRPEPRGRRRASPHRSSTSPRPATWNGSSKKANSSPRDWEQTALRRHRHRLGRRDPGRERQPARDQVLQGPGDKRRSRSRHPEPVQLRLGPLEHHGRLRRGDRRRRLRPPRRWKRSRRCSKRPKPSRAAVATRSPPSARARATSSSPTRTKRSRPKRKAKKSNTSSRPRRCRSKPRSRSPKKRPSRRPKISSSSSGRTKARNCGLKTATARSTRSWSTRSSSRPRRSLFKISKFGGWGKVKDEFFDEEAGSVAKIEGELGVSTSG